LIVGTKVDLREHPDNLEKLSSKGLAPVQRTEAKEMATEMGAVRYIECSALTRHNLDEVLIRYGTTVILNVGWTY
jgi:GTPase SAR1 family protein